jgi:hypothetical protein
MTSASARGDGAGGEDADRGRIRHRARSMIRVAQRREGFSIALAMSEQI